MQMRAPRERSSIIALMPARVSGIMEWVMILLSAPTPGLTVCQPAAPFQPRGNHRLIDCSCGVFFCLLWRICLYRHAGNWVADE
jgi:hypothetical protein